MPIPQVTERIKEAPALALRAVFAGIGQVLLATDKIRSRLLEPGSPLPGSQPEGARPPAPTRPAEETQSAEGWRSDTGNVRMIGERRREQAEPGPRAAHAAPGAGTSASGMAHGAAGAGAGAAQVAVEEAAARLAEPAGGTGVTEAAGTAGTAGASGEPETASPGMAETADTAQATPGTAEATAAARTPEAARAAAPPLPNYDELSLPSLRARLRVLDTAQVRALLDYERAHAGRAPVIAMYERRIAKLESAAR